MYENTKYVGNEVKNSNLKKKNPRNYGLVMCGTNFKGNEIDAHD